MLDDNPMLPEFNVFMPSNSSSLLDQNEQLPILCDCHCVTLSDTLNRKSVDVASLISVVSRNLKHLNFSLNLTKPTWLFKNV